MTARQKLIKTHTRRLERFGRIVLKPYKKLEWDMGLVGEHTGKHRPEEQNYCNSAACAMGHGALDPVFRREGIRAVWRRFKLDDGTGDVRYWWSLTTRYGRLVDFSAWAKFLGLTSREADRVFSGRLTEREEVSKELLRLAREREELGSDSADVLLKGAIRPR